MDDRHFIPLQTVGSSLVPCPLLKKLVERREIVVMGEILRQYTEARINERLHLFLQFPDLRRSFQEIDRKDLAFQKASISLRGEEHTKESLIDADIFFRKSPLTPLGSSGHRPYGPEAKEGKLLSSVKGRSEGRIFQRIIEIRNRIRSCINTFLKRSSKYDVARPNLETLKQVRGDI
jgi:hypothetical protein